MMRCKYWCLVWLLGCGLGENLLLAQSKPGKTREVVASGPQDYGSRNFRLHTDLTADEAQELLKRLETMLTLISKYWGKANQQPIELFVVRDLSVWPNGVIPPDALASVRGGGGLTMHRSEGLTVAGIPVAGKSETAAFAVADHGTPQHEAVHAYCYINFGATGPVWYAEGMAEMGQYWQEKNASAVNCRPEVIEYLRNEPIHSLAEIVDPNQRTGDSWQNYAWRWMLCHLLANNTNYQQRFRPLGMGLLQRQPTSSFESVYGDMAPEIEFEYRLFHQLIQPGFRMDLCSWDWKSKFQLPQTRTATTAKVDAQRGWQASRVLCRSGHVLNVSCTGTWKVSKESDPLPPSGNAEGKGRLMGVILEEMKLSEEFEMPIEGEWTPPSDGKLYVRCDDEWGQLADNSGTVTLKIKLVR